MSGAAQRTAKRVRPTSYWPTDTAVTHFVSDGRPRTGAELRRPQQTRLLRPSTVWQYRALVAAELA